ncbi:MAG: HAD family phosphatase [Clostridia bacterium]|nr:HAD family phosphatase [Clostridia bacterium]
MIKLVAMDLDGTLLNERSVLSERSIRALRACEARGTRMVIASGRGFESARIFARQAGLESPIICANGARVEASPFGPTLMEDLIPEELGRFTADAMFSSGIHFVCYARGVNYRVHIHDKARGNMPALSPDGPAYTLRCCDDEREMFEKGALCAYKFVAFAREEEMDALRLLREKLERETDAAISSSWYDNVEVLAQGAGKGKALRFLADRYGLERDEVMAFGDQMNDMDMLGEAGWPVAMGNAVEELKAVSRLTAPANSEDGVASILEKYVLGGEAG